MAVDRVISGGLLVEGLITPAGGIAGYVAEAAIDGGAYVRKSGAWALLAWADITGVPLTFPPAAHGHPISDVSGLQTALDGKALSSRSISTQHSLSGGGNLTADRTLSLVGDTASPGNSKYYGTNGSGTRGFYDLPSGGGGLADAASDGTSYARKNGNWVAIAWSDLTGKPSTFTPSTHTHDWTEVTGKPSTFPPSTHSHAIADVTGLQAALDAKLALSGGTVTGSFALSGIGADVDSSGSWRFVVRDPTTNALRPMTAAFARGHLDAAATTHSHSISDTSGLQTALDGKAALSHSHAIADVTGLQAALDAKVATSRSVSTQHSLTGGGSLTTDRTLSLVGDSGSPGNSKYYGTDGSGSKGFHDLPGGSANVQPVTKKTAPYTATSADGIILCAFDSPTQAITLPTSGLTNGQVITVTRIGGSESVYIYHGATLADELSVTGDSRTYVWFAADSAFYLIQSIPLS